ncbi:acyltransferase [Bacillus sp. 1NLA3E]|uniref:acyltransferase n=1 Tax=Bacillus sp. 1NLA3E TaxID=666686 RepID=UPI000247EB95|nr:acyltransferase family protein [Bacillus sp. 1NLA3E]
MDILKIVASFSVVLIHTSDLISNYDYFETQQWWAADFLNSISRWCVPVFFMLSGATLLNYKSRYTTASFYKKRLLKVLIPFIVWSFIYIIYRINIGNLVIFDLKQLILITISGPSMFHMWFFYPLIGFYFITPVLAVIVTNSNKRIIFFFVSVCIVQNIVYPLINKFFGFQIGFNIPLATKYVDYFLLGYLLKNLDLSKTYKSIIYILGIIGVMISFISTYILTLKMQKLDSFFMEYESISVLMSSISIFLLFKSIPWERLIKHHGCQLLVNKLSAASFGIYLVHIMVMKNFELLTGWGNDSRSFMVFGAVIIYFISLFIILILKKIPFLNKIVP